MVNLPPVVRFPTREPNEGGVVRKLREHDGLMTGDAAVGIQGEEQRGKDAALRGASDDSPGVKHIQLGELAAARRTHSCSSPWIFFMSCSLVVK